MSTLAQPQPQLQTQPHLATTVAEKAEQERKASLQAHLRVLQHYIDLPSAQEIAVNREYEVLTLESGKWHAHHCAALSFEYLEALVRNVANAHGASFGRQSPVVDCDLYGGERFHAKGPPMAPERTVYINIRKHTMDAYVFENFVAQGYFEHTRHLKALTLSDAAREQLKPHLEDEELALWELASAGKWNLFYPQAVQNYQSIVTSGATFSGKTAFSRSLLEMVDRDERFITLQDAREMPTPNHHNRQDLLFIKGEVTELGSDGVMRRKAGATAKQGLESAMRSTPKRIHISELRGDEAMYYLSGVLSSGHPGGITTIHANSPRDAFLRAALLIKQSKEGAAIELSVIKQMLYQTINVVGQLKFDNKRNKRAITGVYYDPFYRLSLLE